MSVRRLAACAALGTMVSAVSACARVKVAPGPIVTDRPDFTESTETVPAGMVQAEGGFTYARRGPERERSIGELLVRVGAGRRSELRLDLGSYTVSSAAGEAVRGIEDAGLGAKVKLLEGPDQPGSARPALSLLLGTSLPTGARAVREDALQPGAKLAAKWDLAERLSLGANLDYAWASEDGRRFGQTAASASLGYTLSERIGSYLEGFAFAPESRGGSTLGYANGGFTYLVNDDLQLDARGGVRPGAAGHDYFLGTGIARRW
jgi:hypothetical protein